MSLTSIQPFPSYQLPVLLLRQIINEAITNLIANNYSDRLSNLSFFLENTTPIGSNYLAELNSSDKYVFSKNLSCFYVSMRSFINHINVINLNSECEIRISQNQKEAIEKLIEIDIDKKNDSNNNI